MSRLDGVNPVGYSFNNFIGDWHISTSKPEPEWDYKKVEPLYTREQLMPRVQFDKEDMEHWEKLYHTFIGKKFRLVLEKLEKDDYYFDFYKRFIWSAETVAVLANLFSEYDPVHPEETIEIIKPKKWFVVGQDYGDGSDIPILLSISGRIPQYSYVGGVEDVNKNYGYAFDTEEEANQWATPKMHAVELEVE